MESKNAEYFLVSTEQAKRIKKLTNLQAGIMFSAVMDKLTGKEPDIRDLNDDALQLYKEFTENPEGKENGRGASKED